MGAGIAERPAVADHRLGRRAPPEGQVPHAQRIIGRAPG